jgi:hypothetical protein
MKQLFFKGRFVELILSGKKTQTLRKPKSTQSAFAGMSHLYSEGDLISARNRYHEPAFATLRVLGCELTHIDELTDRDASADGFEDLAELKQTIRETYPDADGALWRIRFELVPKE